MQLHLGPQSHTVQQHAVQIGTVQGGVGCAIALLAAAAQAQTGQLASAGGAAHQQLVRESRQALQRLAQTPALQDAGGVGAELKASTDF